MTDEATALHRALEADEHRTEIDAFAFECGWMAAARHWHGVEARERRLRAALEETLRLVSQARSKLFTQSACEHPALLADEATEDCIVCAELLWGFDNGRAGIEPPDNLNSSLFDAEALARAALALDEEAPRG